MTRKLFLQSPEDELSRLLQSRFGDQRKALTITLPFTTHEEEASPPDSARLPLPSVPAIGTVRDVTDPNVAYAGVKVKIDSLTTHRAQGSSAPAESLSSLRAELRTLEHHLLFDSVKASSLYMAARSEADRVRQQLSLNPSPPSDSPHSPQSGPSSDIFGGDDSDDENGVLGILEQTSSITDNTTGMTITLREMSLSKSQASLPKYLLDRHLAKADPSLAVSFRCTSLGWRAFRAEATMYQAGRKHVWTMPEDVACPEEAQAIHFIATTVLHDLTTSDPSPFLKTTKHAPGFVAQLPSSFRELWDELEAGRQATAESTNKQAWLDLRGILKGKLDGDTEKVVRYYSSSLLIVDLKPLSV